jgi:transposase-like protein
VNSLTTKSTGKLLGNPIPSWSPLAGGAEEFPVSDVTEFEAVPQEDIRADLRAVFMGAIRMTLETFLEEEIRGLVGTYRWSRLGRKDHRNGSYLRGLMTSMGHMDVAVPRTRASGSAADVLGRYQRRMPEIDEAIVASYVNGVSTRKMGKVTEALTGEQVGKSTVSRVTHRLEQKVEDLRRAPITEPITYLYLDGTFLDARWARRVENVAALVAYGIGPSGRRQLLGITIGAQESEASWTELLAQLTKRGLTGVKLVIADAHAGLAAAARHHLPEAKLQRCVVHLQRNALAQTPWRLRGRLGREITNVFAAQTVAEASKRLETLRAGLGKELPEAMATLDGGFAAATQFYAFPKAHWRRIKTTNGLERLHAEIKRRTNAIGAFPDRSSALRLITAVAMAVTAIWAQRLYLDMSHFKVAVQAKAA